MKVIIVVDGELFNEGGYILHSARIKNPKNAFITAQLISNGEFDKFNFYFLTPALLRYQTCSPLHFSSTNDFYYYITRDDFIEIENDDTFFYTFCKFSLRYPVVAFERKICGRIERRFTRVFTYQQFIPFNPETTTEEEFDEYTSYESYLKIKGEFEKDRSISYIERFQSPTIVSYTETETRRKDIRNTPPSDHNNFNSLANVELATYQYKTQTNEKGFFASILGKISNITDKLRSGYQQLPNHKDSGTDSNLFL